jgi:hypothetical protein
MTSNELRDITTIPLAIQCPACGTLYMRERHIHKTSGVTTQQYIVGHYGAIQENPEWLKHQEASRHTWYRQYN